MKRIWLLFVIAVSPKEDMKMKHILSCLLLLSASSPLLAQNFTFQNVINPGDPAFDQLLGINNAGTIAGYYGDGTLVLNNGFTTVPPYTAFTAENFPGAVQTQVVGISNTGETVGFYIDSAGVNHGFTDIRGTFTSVSNPNTTTVTQLLGVNAKGEAAGYYTDAAGNFVPFTWRSGTFKPITFAGEVSAQATDVNAAGVVTGFNMTSGSTSHGFLDVRGTVTTLDFPGSVFTQAFGLNDCGEVVGSYVDAAGNTHGFIYNIATMSFQEINDPNAVGPAGTVINGINDRGQIVGFYTDANGNVVGLVGTPTVPQPGCLAQD
jgi:uncharacterized membrane protein